MRHLIPISGKDSLAAALAQSAMRPELPYEFFFADVGVELPETYTWLSEVEQRTGWNIVRVGLPLLARIRSYGGFLPGPRARYCTKECKIEPMEELIGKGECTVYYGLRADEARTGYVPIGKPNITPAYPLRELGIDLRGVFAILDARGLVPPDFFWARLHEAASAALRGGGWDGWEGLLSRTERRLLFAGRTRGNCFMCFFQRRYEWLWLYEVHPPLFAEAEGLEKDGYSFMEDFPLKEFHREEVRRRVFGKRVKDVCRAVTAKFQGGLFEEPSDNELALISCGLLCGK